MEQKQTAVEWFYTKLITGKFTGKDTIEFLYETAKQMEKEQTISAVKYGCSDWGSAKDAESYYNETYGETKN
jgi:hypothetical protein